MGVLVTGGAGYIGSHVVAAAQQRGERVVVLDDLSTGRAELVPHGVPLVAGDAGDAPFVAALIRQHGIRAVMHFAAKTSVPDSVIRPQHYYYENVVKSQRLIEAVIQSGEVLLVFSSSAAIYGTCAGGIASEDTPPAPLSPYGRSKLMTEWMLADAASAHGLRYVALRYFNVAGADPQGRRGQMAPQSTHLIRRAIQTALGRLPALTIHGVDYPTPDGTCVRDYIHVSDLARAHLDALDYLRRDGASAALNCGYGHGASVREVIAAVQRAARRGFPVVEGPRRAGDPARLIASAGQIRERLGWRPEYTDLDTIVAHALAWERHLISS